MLENFTNNQQKVDEYFMTIALQQAKKAYELGEVPVGCVLTHKNKIIFKSHNQVEQLRDVTAHSEVIAISSSSEYLQTKYLPECTLYVTLEPCIMCAGAIGWAQIKRIVFGAYDYKKGYSVKAPDALHPKAEVIGGVLQQECETVLMNFFKEKRK